MEQRRLRLGDILDDYCPRERRVTNHAIVAMVEDDVKQTRCTTCDAEHAYKGGKEPRRRKKDSPGVLYEEVLAGMPEAADIPPVPIPDPPAPEVPTPEVLTIEGSPTPEPEPPVQEPEEAEQPRSDEGDDGPFHRRLIRATLPRPEGQKDVRQIPDFTIRHNGHGQRRGHGGSGNGNGQRPHGMRRFGHSGGGNPGMPGNRGPGRGQGGPGFRSSTGSGRGPSPGPGRGPQRGPSAGRRKRSR